MNSSDIDFEKDFSCSICGNADNVSVDIQFGYSNFGCWTRAIVKCNKCGRRKQSGKETIKLSASDDEENRVFLKIMTAVKNEWNRKEGAL